MRRVGRSLRSPDRGSDGDNDETLPFESCVTNLKKETTIGRQFGWGATPLRRKQRPPMISSEGSEILQRV